MSHQKKNKITQEMIDAIKRAASYERCETIMCRTAGTGPWHALEAELLEASAKALREVLLEREIEIPTIPAH